MVLACTNIVSAAKNATIIAAPAGFAVAACADAVAPRAVVLGAVHSVDDAIVLKRKWEKSRMNNPAGIVSFVSLPSC